MEASENGYNTSVAITAGESDYQIGGFSLDRVSESDILVDEYVGGITVRVKSELLQENFFQDRSEHGRIGKLAMQTLASDYWTEILGFDPLVPPEHLELRREEKESDAHYKARRIEFLNAPIQRYPRKLALAIKGSLTHEHAEAHANALVHLLRVTFKRSRNKAWFEEYISRNHKLIPSMTELKRLGKLPDVKIKEFKNIFHPSEWRIVLGSRLLKADEELKDILKTKLESVEAVTASLNAMTRIRDEVEQDPVSVEALRLKKVRLGFASRWRKTLPRDIVLQVMKELPRHLNDDKVLDTFSPFSLGTAAGYAGSETAPSRLHYNVEDHIYQWAVPSIGQHTSAEVESLGLEYAAALNR
jgi:hypothetical protein